MKKICKKTQQRLSELNGDKIRLAELFPDLAEHLRGCSACQAEAEALKTLREQLRAQHLQIQDEAFWADFYRGLEAKLARPRPVNRWVRWYRRLQDFLAGLFFQPAYRWGVAVLILFTISYVGYRKVEQSGDGVWDSPNFFYESYQEAAAGNPFETTLNDPSDVLITTAEWSEGVQ